MGFFAELRRRGVLKVATAYLIVSWLTLEIGHTLFQIFELPHLALKLVFALLALGFPVTLLLVWHGRLGASHDAPAPPKHGRRTAAAAHPEHHGSPHEGPWLAGIFAVVALLAVTVAIGVRFFGMSAGSPHGAPAAHDASAATHAPAAPAGHAAAAGDYPEHSVAVLPFANISEAQGNEYFADGLTEELIDLLARLPQLHVAARTSSFYFKGRQATVADVGAALHVRYVLEGSVRKAGDALRITVQLVRTSDGFHEFSQTFERRLGDIFRVQEEIARAVVARLAPTLSGTPAQATPINVEAYNLYLQARYFTDRDTPEELDRAVGLYAQVIELEPNYAPAYAWLAQCHVRRVANGEGTDGSGYGLASGAAQHATRLDPELAEGYLTLATAQMQYEPDWPTVSALVDKARRLDPDNPLTLQIQGHLTQATGSLREAVDYFRQGLDRDPLNMLLWRYLARALYYSDRNEEAQAALRHALDLNGQFPALYYELARVLLAQGQVGEAVRAAEAERSPAYRSFALPLVYWSAERKPEAWAALAALEKSSVGSEFQVAETYAWFGRSYPALNWLEQARVKHDPGLIWLRHDPALRLLEKDPRYGQFLKKIRLPPP